MPSAPRAVRRLLVSVLAVALATVVGGLPGCDAGTGLSGRDGGLDLGGDDGFPATPDGGDVGDLGLPPDLAPDARPDAPLVDAPDQNQTPPVALWQLPRQGPNHFALPWPSDLTLTPSGHADLNYVPNDRSATALNNAVTALNEVVDGFSTVGATYFRFSTSLSTTGLPATPADWLAAQSPLQIVDIDEASPERGTRRPGQLFYRDEATDYWPERTLAIAPAFGFPLRERTRYAVVVKKGLLDVNGGVYERDVDLEAVLAPGADAGGDDAAVAARTATAPALAALAKAGVETAEILSLAVFRTQDCSGELFRVIDAVRTTAAEPALGQDVSCTAGQAFHRCTGHYGPNPVYQQGPLPYAVEGTGGFAFDAGGAPVVDHTIDIRFSLAIPPGQAPPGGWPVVIYAHGTGGNSSSHFRDGTAAALASRGVASIGFDQIFNGERIVGNASDSNAELQFYNVLNITAGRTNNRQAAVDLVQMGRLTRNGALVIAAGISPTGEAIAFRRDQVGFFGHSQGGINGPLWFAAEDGAGAGVFSGAGGTLSISLIQKTEPVDIPGVVAAFLGISPSSGELVALHPVMTLLQTAVDVEDPVNYGRLIIREPRPGLTPKHVYQTQGFVDHYAPPDGIATLAQVTGLQLVQPVLHDVPDYPLGGLGVAPEGPVSLNLANGTATGVWQQWDAPDGVDGHFVVFEVPQARDRAAGFLASFFENPAAPVVP